MFALGLYSEDHQMETFSSTSENYGYLDNATDLNTSVILGEDVPHPDVALPYSVLLSIAIYLTIVGILSTFGNVLFILTVIRWRYLKNNSHMLLLLNMAVCDLAISITGYPYTTISGYVGEWVFGSLMCQLYAFLCFTFSQVSMNTLVAVSIFRYIAICHPHKKHLLTSSTSVKAISIVWIHALFWTVAPLLGWSSYTFEPTKISCSFNWNDRTWNGISYVFGTTIFCYLTHIFCLVWCYKRIFRAVYRLQSSSRLKGFMYRKANRNTTTTLNTSLSGSTVENEDEINEPPDSPSGLPRCQSLIVFSFGTGKLTEMELHVLGMNVSMCLGFLIFWTPYAIISVVSIFQENLQTHWYIFPTIFAKTSCMMNPVLYGLTNSFLRKQLLLVLRGFLGLTSPIEDFEVMRQRQQDGLYNKEGIFVGKRAGAIAMSKCPCEGCIASRKQKQFTNVILQNEAKIQTLVVTETQQPSPKAETVVNTGEHKIKEELVNCDDDKNGSLSGSIQHSTNNRSRSSSVKSNEHDTPAKSNESQCGNTTTLILNVNTLSNGVIDEVRTNRDNVVSGSGHICQTASSTNSLLNISTLNLSTIPTNEQELKET